MILYAALQELKKLDRDRLGTSTKPFGGGGVGGSCCQGDMCDWKYEDLG